MRVEENLVVSQIFDEKIPELCIIKFLRHYRNIIPVRFLRHIINLVCSNLSYKDKQLNIELSSIFGDLRVALNSDVNSHPV